MQSQYSYSHLITYFFLLCNYSIIAMQKAEYQQQSSFPLFYGSGQVLASGLARIAIQKGLEVETALECAKNKWTQWEAVPECIRKHVLRSTKAWHRHQKTLLRQRAKNYNNGKITIPFLLDTISPALKPYFINLTQQNKINMQRFLLLKRMYKHIPVEVIQNILKPIYVQIRPVSPSALLVPFAQSYYRSTWCAQSNYQVTKLAVTDNICASTHANGTTYSYTIDKNSFNLNNKPHLNSTSEQNTKILTHHIKFKFFENHSLFSNNNCIIAKNHTTGITKKILLPGNYSLLTNPCVIGTEQKDSSELLVLVSCGTKIFVIKPFKPITVIQEVDSLLSADITKMFMHTNEVLWVSDIHGSIKVFRLYKDILTEIPFHMYGSTTGIKDYMRTVTNFGTIIFSGFKKQLTIRTAFKTVQEIETNSFISCMCMYEDTLISGHVDGSIQQWKPTFNFISDWEKISLAELVCLEWFIAED